MLDKIVYFSGVHGSGKSTLIKEIAKHNNFLEHTRNHSLTLEDTYIRAVWRLTKYYIETREQIELASNNPSKMIIGDRCVYDNFAYMNAFQSLGWISNKEIKHHSDVFEALFPVELRPKLIIHISPPFDWVKNNLEKRWQKESKKWREDNFEYLELVMQSYNSIYTNTSINILHLEEIDYYKRTDIVLNWLNTIKK